MQSIKIALKMLKFKIKKEVNFRKLGFVCFQVIAPEKSGLMIACSTPCVFTSSLPRI